MRQEATARTTVASITTFPSATFATSRISTRRLVPWCVAARRFATEHIARHRAELDFDEHPL